MTKKVRSNVALTAIFALGSVLSFAQSGADTYKAKCASCHGATGMADSGAGKAMKVKPVSDAAVKKMTQAEMVAVTKDGKGKMPAFKDKLSDDQVKAAVDYYISLAK